MVSGKTKRIPILKKHLDLRNLVRWVECLFEPGSGKNKHLQWTYFVHLQLPQGLCCSLFHNCTALLEQWAGDLHSRASCVWAAGALCRFSLHGCGTGRVWTTSSLLLFGMSSDRPPSWGTHWTGFKTSSVGRTYQNLKHFPWFNWEWAVSLDRVGSFNPVNKAKKLHNTQSAWFHFLLYWAA